MTNISAAFLLVFSLQGATAPIAQTTTADDNPLKDVKHLVCTFTVSASGRWRGDQPEAAVKSPELMKLEIADIDTEGGSAVLTGTTGPTFTPALLTSSSLDFLDRSATGALNVTTIFAPSDPHARVFRAVQSRHDYFPLVMPGFVTEPSVSQHYGTCEIPQ